MLKAKNIIENLDLIDREIYGEMLKQINIPDFYRVVAQYSGLEIKEINDKVISDVLIMWAKQKYRFWKMLGNNTRKDCPINYQRTLEDKRTDFIELGKQFPTYALWIEHFEMVKNLKLSRRDLSYRLEEVLRKYFPNVNIDGMMLTRFFKNHLQAPDKLVTDLGRIFENDKIEAKYTISIDPVDMMLASENPYNWQSCYRLETPNESSHADGCMAAVLDNDSLISYIWEKEGEFKLYDKFNFKSIRYYRMRQWLLISEDFSAIHFNSIYPGKDSYEKEFYKSLRECVEKIVSDYTGVENKWRKAEDYIPIKQDENQNKDYYYCTHKNEVEVERKYYYGYSEFSRSSVWVNSIMRPKMEEVDKDFKPLLFNVYNVRIPCFCGCGGYPVPSGDTVDEDSDGTVYNGEGFNCNNFYENEYEPPIKWCDYLDDYCTRECYEEDDCDCNCPYYNKMHPHCPAEAGARCWDHWDNDPESEYTPTLDENGNTRPCEHCGMCNDCSVWRHLTDEQKAEFNKANKYEYISKEDEANEDED